MRMVMYGDLEFEACIDDLLSRLFDKNHHKTQAERKIFAQYISTSKAAQEKISDD